MRSTFFLVLFFMKLQAQDTIVFPKIDLFQRNIVEVSYGLPLGDLANKYEASVNSAIYFRTKVGKKQFVDFGFELGGIVQGRNVNYKVHGQELILDGSKSAFLLGFRYTRFLYQSRNENFHIESNSGIGWKYLYYSKPEEDRYKDLDFSPALHTIALTQGLKIMYFGIGIHCNYQYAPYNLFTSNAENNFGSSSLNFGVSGSWNF